MIISQCQCNLCCSGKLPGVGSHIFSDFLIKETVNVSGKANARGRGNEFLFTLSARKGAEMYFRGAATQNALDYLNKKYFTDEEVEDLKNLENPLVDKYLVCGSCEKKFQPIEDAFKKTYESAIKSMESDQDTVSYDLEDDESAFMNLFILMNIWRASTSGNINWNLDNHSQYCLTELMHDVLIKREANEQSILEAYYNSKKNFNCISTLCFLSDEILLDTGEPNQNLIFCYHSTDPYLLVINRLVIFVSSNNFESVGTPKICEGIIDNLVEYVGQLENVLYSINSNKITEINKNCALESLENFQNHVVEFARLVNMDFFGTEPDEQTINEILGIASKFVNEHYKYGASETDMLREFAQYFVSRLENSIG